MAMVGRAGPVPQGPPMGGDQLQRGPWLGRGLGQGPRALGWAGVPGQGRTPEPLLRLGRVVKVAGARRALTAS